VVLDTTAPAAPSVPDLQAASDSGASSTDNITNASSRAFDIGGTTNGTTVQLYRGATLVASAAGNGSTVTITDSASVPDTTYNYTARQVDTAGNFADSSALPVTLDTVSAPSVPDLQAGSDSGASSTDNITKTTPRAFDIASTETGATVELLRGGSPIANTTGTGATVTLSDSSTPADNTYAYATRQTDLAGNVGTSSALNVVLDTAAMANAPDLQAASDTGASSTDNRTSAATPHVFDVAIAESGSTVELLRGGSPVSGASATGSGTVQLSDNDALADGAYQYSVRETDVAGNVATSTDLAVTIDTTAPTVSSVQRGDPSPTSAASVTFNVNFSESVTGVDAADFALTTSGSITGASVTNVSGSGAGYTVTVNTGSGDGNIRLDVLNDGTIKDVMNLALGSTFTTGEVYIVDRSNPTVTSINRAGSSPTGAASVQFTVTFSEAVSGVDTGDFSTVNTGSVTGTSVTGVLPASGPAQTYTVTVNTGTGTPGTVGLNLDDNDTVVDVVNKPLGGAGDNADFVGQTYDIDKTAPDTTVTYAGVDNPAHGPTASTVINFTVTFTKPVTGFTNTDITLGGTAGAT
ncbi:MAG TPA: Ig-like domain-containing protein, partial [Pyrinomonadaceae bacterium]|nr:Ig-like domain-containing protein [Pyrinomonadaceae bacterium]